jgi:hypothetical protein
MKKLISEAGEFGPFETVETDAEGYICDGIVYPLAVVGECLVADYEPPVVDNSEAEFAALVKQYDGVVQGHIDVVAQGFGYGDPNRPLVSPILHAITYADEPAVPKFQAEGRLLRAWRSLYWAATWPILQAVRAGERPVPEPGALLEELDAAAPPPTPADVDAEVARMAS